ncbi:MAG: hypothetical protein AVDCRST_MAG93-1333, partial [uncultured Chloroflexia bacterium]
ARAAGIQRPDPGSDRGGRCLRRRVLPEGLGPHDLGGKGGALRQRGSRAEPGTGRGVRDPGTLRDRGTLGKV